MFQTDTMSGVNGQWLVVSGELPGVNLKIIITYYSPFTTHFFTTHYSLFRYICGLTHGS